MERIDRLIRGLGAGIVVVERRAAKVLREALDDERVGEVLRELAPGLHVERVARVERRVEHVGGVRALGERELDRVFFVGLAAAVVPLVELEGDVRLRGGEGVSGASWANGEWGQRLTQ